jgi:hypothetical protein
MKAGSRLSIVLLLVSSLFAQTGPVSKPVSRKTSRKRVNAELQALKDAVAAQQAQIQALSQQLQQTNQQLQQTNQQFQQAQQQLQQAQQTATDAQQKAALASSAASSAATKDTVDHLSSEFADVQTALANNVVSTQEQQKRFAGIEATLGRFRWTGDIRVRGDDSFQRYDGCTLCNDRNRANIRIRFGFDGTLNEDFVAGVALATGSLGNPTSTNEILTNFFDRKTIGLDRGYVTYNPVAHRWLSLTAGKFLYTWTRTSVTFDPDINPEGFVERLSKNFETVPIVKNLNLQFMQLLYNENAGTSSSTLGAYGGGRDSFAVGGQAGARLQPLTFWTLTPSFTLLNFRYPDALLSASFFATQATSTNNVNITYVNSSGKTVVATFPLPGEGPNCATPTSSGLQTSQACALAPYGMTNSTYVDSKGVLRFLSRFLYADLILNNQFQTGMARFPLNLLLEYEDNLNASDHPFDYTYTNTSKGALDTFANQSAAQAAANPNLGKQSHAYLADISLGQLKKKGDVQFGYAFLREEQDAAISSWGESEQRSPTNVLQHRFYALWRFAPNTTASFTWWHGRTLDPYLQNALLAAGMAVSKTAGTGVLVPGSGAQEPWLNRLQFDLIYTF